MAIAIRSGIVILLAVHDEFWNNQGMRYPQLTGVVCWVVALSYPAFATHELSDKRCVPKAPTEQDAPTEVNASEVDAEQWYTVRQIDITVQPIFDESNPDENNWLFRGANYLKIATRPEVIENDLLFEPGSTVNGRTLEESERILRRHKFLRDAHITVSDPCAEEVDVNVVVKDVWTLLPDISFSRGGGENSSRLGFRDSDFLGTGKSILVVRKENNERSGILFGYGDPNLFGTRNRLSLQYQDNDDGQVHHFSLAHPFFSLSDTWASGVAFNQNERVDSLYYRGDEYQHFFHNERTVHAYLGFSQGLINDRTHRFTFGVSEERSNFLPTIDTTNATPLPDDRLYQYPWVSWQTVEDKFVKTTHINQMSQTEDLNLGLSAQVQLGYAQANEIQDEDSTIVRAEVHQFLPLSQQLTFFYFLSGSTYLQADGPQQQIVQSLNRLYLNQKEQRQWALTLELTHGVNLFVDQPLTIGGDSGLRGYPIHYQTGDRRALLSLEKRFYLYYDVWSLFDVGAAIFADYGRAWNEGEDNGANGDWLSDVGFGFRFSPTRTGSDSDGGGSVLHVDFAAPLNTDEDPELDRWQLLVTLRNRF